MQTPESACIGKRWYTHKRDAKRAAVSSAARGGGYAMRAYRCPFCDLWHVGGDHRKENRESSP